nr:TadE/TadG family type IV pilus assembly protein [uncultured Brevundimonas sp.]
MKAARNIVSRLARDTKGLAAVEFAILAPVMILIYVGVAEVCQGYMAMKRTNHVAAMVGDLVTQNSAIDQTGFTNIFGIGDQIMAPFPVASLKQRITSVTRISATKLQLDWSKGDGMAPMTLSEAVVPDDVIAPGQTVIITEAYYTYESPLGYVLPTLTNFKHTTYLQPRDNNTVTCVRAC